MFDTGRNARRQKRFSTLRPCLMPIFASTVHPSSWGLWDTLKKEGKRKKKKTERETVCFHAWISGGCITPIASHFQTWSMSIGFKMKPLRGNCKVMWFSININALGNATRARKHNLFYLPSDPSHIYQSIQIDSTVYGPDLPEFVSLSPP